MPANINSINLDGAGVLAGVFLAPLVFASPVHFRAWQSVMLFDEASAFLKNDFEEPNRSARWLLAKWSYFSSNKVGTLAGVFPTLPCLSVPFVLQGVAIFYALVGSWFFLQQGL